MRTEETLREAFLLLDEQAPRTLDQPARASTARTPRRRRFVAPIVAAAAVTAVAIGTVGAVSLWRSPSHVSLRPTSLPSVAAHPTWNCPGGGPPQSQYLVSLDTRGRDHLDQSRESCPGADRVQSNFSVTASADISATVTVWRRGAFTPPTLSGEKAVDIDGTIGHVQSRPNGPMHHSGQGSSMAVGQTTLYWQYAPGAYVEATSSGGLGPPTKTKPYAMVEPATAVQLLAIAKGTSWRGQIAAVPLTLSKAPAGLNLTQVVEDRTGRVGVALTFCSTKCDPYVPNVSIDVTEADANSLGSWAGKKSVTVNGHRAAYEPPLFDTSARLEMIAGPWDIVVTGQAKAQKTGTGMGYHPEVSYTQAQLTEMAASVTAVATTDRSTWPDVSAAIPRP